ncbi:hypothetical protein IscW_ISCW006667 [Ixodes scapularis]|uniref:Uncharacterized protein n=1 Tax=Ixodes scapularis TaxID=6945 RepID=B7PML0_IXOSC|nr:hypothetical protein IscW_ISCW006667 [Ixodes scapularis]|eukprot:XP_002435008.1 hypothetical protein IscW_ISCW006667 [Ixodes scapularis]
MVKGKTGLSPAHVVEQRCYFYEFQAFPFLLRELHVFRVHRLTKYPVLEMAN